MKYEPLQIVCKNIGISGCYFLCICKVAELIIDKVVNVPEIYTKATKTNVYGQPIMDDDCYMNNPEALLEIVTNKKITLWKEFDLSYIPKENEYIIGCYEWDDTMETYYHFVLLNTDKMVEYDPYGFSKTVKNGKLVSLRVIRVEN